MVVWESISVCVLGVVVEIYHVSVDFTIVEGNSLKQATLSASRHPSLYIFNM